jgi:hypothetical protein
VTKTTARKRRSASLSQYESSEQLRARVRAFALATRQEAMKSRTIPFPEHVSVLAGPLRRARPKAEDPDMPTAVPATDAE